VCFVSAFRGIYRLIRHNDTTEVEMVGEAIFARITDLKYVEKIGMLTLKCLSNLVNLIFLHYRYVSTVCITYTTYWYFTRCKTYVHATKLLQLLFIKKFNTSAMDRLTVVNFYSNSPDRWLLMIQKQIMSINVYSRSYRDIFGEGSFARTLKSVYSFL